MKAAAAASFRAAAEPEDWEPPTKAAPPACGHCGRFVPRATIEDVYDEERDDYRMLGECKTHGRVEVT